MFEAERKAKTILIEKPNGLAAAEIRKAHHYEAVIQESLNANIFV